MKDVEILRFKNIPVTLHPISIVFLIAIITSAFFSKDGIMAVVEMILLFSVVIISIICHEFGHSLVTQHYNFKVSKIMLILPLGGAAISEGLPQESNKEFNIAIAGPLVSLGLSLLFLPFYLLFPKILIIKVAFTLNIMLFIFNLLPVFPMDGGRILRSILFRKMDFLSATAWSVKIAKIMILLISVYAVTKFNISLLLICGFIYIAAKNEYESWKKKECIEFVKYKFPPETYPDSDFREKLCQNAYIIFSEYFDRIANIVPRKRVKIEFNT